MIHRQLQNLRIEELHGEQIERFKTVSEWLEDAAFPAIPRVDKTRPEDHSSYRKDEVTPPEVLFFGTRQENDFDWEILNSRIAVAVIGASEKHTKAGREVARLIARSAVEYGFEVDQGTVVITGGAPGIDSHGNKGAFLAKGRTVAVLANPVINGLFKGSQKPKFENNLLTHGGLVSEQTEYKRPTYRRAIGRDYLTSALSDIVVVVECQRISGTVDNALKAILQGRQLLVVDWSRVGNSLNDGVLWKGNKFLLERPIGDWEKPTIRFPGRTVPSLQELGPLFKECLEKLTNQ